mmetsp:Transcript_79432/g.233423  ORF Transcript_79432/g.233423 Transcript_79432/m.233423 type:complete len:236 (+) Transcript_79432:1503-2210(+)
MPVHPGRSKPRSGTRPRHRERFHRPTTRCSRRRHTVGERNLRPPPERLLRSHRRLCSLLTGWPRTSHPPRPSRSTHRSLRRATGSPRPPPPGPRSARARPRPRASAGRRRGTRPRPAPAPAEAATGRQGRQRPRRRSAASPASGLSDGWSSGRRRNKRRERLGTPRKRLDVAGLPRRRSGPAVTRRGRGRRGAHQQSERGSAAREAAAPAARAGARGASGSAKTLAHERPQAERA